MSSVQTLCQQGHYPARMEGEIRREWRSANAASVSTKQVRTQLQPVVHVTHVICSSSSLHSCHPHSNTATYRTLTPLRKWSMLSQTQKGHDTDQHGTLHHLTNKKQCFPYSLPSSEHSSP